MECDIRNFYRLTSDGKRVVKWEKTNAAHFFDSVLKLLKKLTYQANVEFSLELGPDVPETCLLPCRTLTQVLLNLGFNAAKHAAGGKVRTAWCGSVFVFFFLFCC